MATILAYTSPSLGHLFPIAALLIELQRRGHRIAVKTLAAGLDTAGELGFDAEAIDPRIEEVAMTDWAAPNVRAALKVTMGGFARRADSELDDLRTAIDAYQPDALIIDANCWGAASVADACDIPWSAFWPYTPFLRSRGTPPFGPGLPPWPGWYGRMRDEALRPLITGMLKRTMLGSLNSIRANAGAPAVKTADDFLRRAPLMLVATGEPFEYHHPDWGPSVQLIGACDFDPAPDPAPAWLDGIDRPIVLVSNSSERQDDNLLPVTAMAALADQPVHVVATFPAGVPGGIPVPRNATVAEFVPHSVVLDRAVCAITHGGMGSTQKALARGVPVCVVPHGRDQFEVARRVEFARCGTRLPAHKLGVATLKEKVLQSMSMTAGAKRVADGFTATGGVGHGADLIERQLFAGCGDELGA
jgi:MGT family glycosyltransferase